MSDQPLLPNALEARAWLHAARPSGFAGNRFAGLDAARAFVEQLYMLGALKVVIPSVFAEPWRIAEHGGPYADTLVVVLPTDPKQRAAVFDVHATESAQEGFEATPDVGQATLTFWWD